MLYTPASLNDDFITVEKLSQSNSLVGKLNILVYFLPTSDLYFKAPGIPAGVFSYDVSMTRIPEDIKATQYPYVTDNVGPIELDQFFGF